MRHNSHSSFKIELTVKICRCLPDKCQPLTEMLPAGVNQPRREWLMLTEWLWLWLAQGPLGPA